MQNEWSNCRSTNVEVSFGIIFLQIVYIYNNNSIFFYITILTLVEFPSCVTSSEVLRTASASPWPSNSLIRLLRLSADVDRRNLDILIFAY